MKEKKNLNDVTLLDFKKMNHDLEIRRHNYNESMREYFNNVSIVFQKIFKTVLDVDLKEMRKRLEKNPNTIFDKGATELKILLHIQEVLSCIIDYEKGKNQDGELF